MSSPGRVHEDRVKSGSAPADLTVDLATSESDEAWLTRTRVFLTPIAGPSIMGLFGFMISTAMVGAWQAGWYGGPTTSNYLWPFAFFAGGLLQAIAAIVAFRARDGVAVAAHTVWGSFWMAWSVLMALTMFHALPPIMFGTVNTAFAFWFVVLTVTTISAFFGALGRSLLFAITLGTLAAGAALTAAGFWSGGLTITQVGGWLFVVSAAAAWLTVTAMILEETFGRTIIPLGKWTMASNVPGRQATRPLARPAGMPGVRVGQ
jgi:succinate-acetate transporter protein